MLTHGGKYVGKLLRPCGIMMALFTVFTVATHAAQDTIIPGQQPWFNWRDTREQDLKEREISPLTVSDEIVMRLGETVAVGSVRGTAGNWELVRNAVAPIQIRFRKRTMLEIDSSGQMASLRPGEGINIGADLYITWDYALPYRNRAAVFAYDRDHNARLAFSVLTQWHDYDPAYQISGKFIPLESLQAQFINTTLGLSTIIYKIGMWEAQWNDVEVKIPVFVENQKYDRDTALFIPFTDMTNFGTTHKSGRYIRTLTVGSITSDQMLTIDFNYAENPFSALSDYTNSPIPGRESHIELDVAAGEKRPTRRLPTRLKNSTP